MEKQKNNNVKREGEITTDQCPEIRLEKLDIIFSD